MIRAIAEYQRIVQDDPNDARTLLKIGDLQARLQAYPEAIATYDRETNRRFARNNPGGPGNPFARQTAACAARS